MGDKGREIFLTFQWETVDRGSEHRQSVSEKDILEHVAGKFKTYLEVKENPIMAAVQFDRRWQQPGESFEHL